MFIYPLRFSLLLLFIKRTALEIYYIYYFRRIANRLYRWYNKDGIIAFFIHWILKNETKRNETKRNATKSNRMAKEKRRKRENRKQGYEILYKYGDYLSVAIFIIYAEVCVWCSFVRNCVHESHITSQNPVQISDKKRKIQMWIQCSRGSERETIYSPCVVRFMLTFGLNAMTIHIRCAFIPSKYFECKQQNIFCFVFFKVFHSRSSLLFTWHSVSPQSSFISVSLPAIDRSMYTHNVF